jgi:nicotinamide phosphoribosyltransferase
LWHVQQHSWCWSYPIHGTFKTIPLPAEAASLDDIAKPMGFDDAMLSVWENGRLLQDWTFAEVRARANAARL